MISKLAIPVYGPPKNAYQLVAGARLTQAAWNLNQTIENKQYESKYIFCLAGLIVAIAIPVLFKWSVAATVLLAIVPISIAFLIKADERSLRRQLDFHMTTVANIYLQVAAWFTKIRTEKIKALQEKGLWKTETVEAERKSVAAQGFRVTNIEEQHKWAKELADKYDGSNDSEFPVWRGWALTIANSVTAPIPVPDNAWSRLQQACRLYIKPNNYFYNRDDQ